MKAKAFTLIELLAVLMIIGILATVLVVGFGKSKQKSVCTRIRQDFELISKAAQSHYEYTGSWATNTDFSNQKPAFVPDFLNEWPDANYLGTSYYFDWENWPILSGNYEYMQAITLRQKPTTSISGYSPGSLYPNTDQVRYYYCVQDENPSPTSHHDCKTQGFFNPQVTLPTALNRGGSCP